MKTKKISIVFAIFLCAFFGVFFSACQEPTIQEIFVKEGSIVTTIEQDSAFSTNGIVIMAKLSNGKEQELNASDCTFSSIDTSLLGTQTLIISYNTFKTEITIKIIAKAKGYTILGFNDPTFVSVYNRNKTTQNEYKKTGSQGQKGFTDLNNEYLVGDDNVFVYSPVMQIKDSNNNPSELSEYKADIEVYVFDNNTKEYKLLNETEKANYVSVDSTKHTFDFTEQAIGNKFKISVLPSDMNETEELIISASVFEFKVVDGWNAYTAKDISLFDNLNALDKWTEYKTANNIPLDIKINALILHNDISITDNDIPKAQFLGDDEVKPSDEDYDRAYGSLKDSYREDYGLIYNRYLESGETFTIEGNYFQLSAENISLIAREIVNGNYPVVKEGEAITVHTALFGFRGVENSANKAKYNVNNISLFGNTKKSETTALSGGLIFMKAQNADFNAYNNLSQCWFISYFFEGNNDYSDNISHVLEKVNCFDAYNTMIYNWANRDLSIKNSVMIGAGGPVMICDHTENNETTGEGGHITNVKVYNSVLESYVAGSEGWFATYEGSGALAGQIKAFSPMFAEFNKTLTNASGEKINLVAVYKSGSVEGLSNSFIRGTYKVDGHETGLSLTNDQKYLEFAYETGLAAEIKQNVWSQLKAGAIAQGADETAAEAYADANVYAQTMAYLNSNDTTAQGYKTQLIAGVKQFASQGMFMQTDSGAVAFPNSDGTWYKQASVNFDGTPNATKMSATKENLYIYLPNGMAAVLGMFDKA